MRKVLFLLWITAAIASAQTANVTVDGNGNVLNGKVTNFATGKLSVNGVLVTGTPSDASATVKGVTKLSVAPVSSSNPIAVGDNDPRNSDARTPTVHAGSHASAGSDPVTLIISQITGLQGALDLKAPLASPTFTGVPLAPTAAIDTNTTQIATTGFVLAQAASATPIVASTGAVGASTRYARQDHVHPAQTSVTGNAGTATALQTARTINGTSFDGTANIIVTAAAGTLTGTTLASNVTASSLLSASGGSFGTAAFTASSAYATSSQGVTTLSLATPNVLYTTPVTFSNSSGAWTGTLSLNTQSANTVFAGPTTGGATAPTMRALVTGDIPTLNQNTTGSAASLSISGQTGLLTFTGLTSTNRAKTVRDAADTILELGGSYTPTGTWTSLPLTTPKITTGINDANGNSMLAFTATASAVDGFTFTNAATANPATVTMAATGSDSNINMTLTSKGSGNVFFNPSNTGILTISGSGNIGVITRDVGYYGWASGGITATTTTADTALARDAAGGVQINNGTGGQWGYLKIGTRDSGTTTITNAFITGHRSSGTPAAGLGEAWLGNLDSSTTADQNAFKLYYKWSDATHATRTSAFGLQLVNSAAALADVLTISGAGLVTIPGSLSVTGQTTLGDVSLFGTGTAPSSAAGYALLAIGANQTIQGIEALGASSTLVISQNASYASGASWKYISTDVASNYYQSGGTHVFRRAPSGTAGTAITWTTPMGLGANGISTYNNIATEGNGVAAIVKWVRVTAQTAANSSIASYTTPASDGSYLVSGNINVTAAVAISTSLNVNYTDETNTARTMIIPISGLGGTFLAGGLATSTGPFESSVMHIRTKASTAITIYTAAGTFTSATYNAEGVIRQIQ